MANVTGIFKVTASQYSQLKSQGYIDVGGNRYVYSENALYLVDADTVKTAIFSGIPSRTDIVNYGTSDTVWLLPSLSSGEYYAIVESFSNGVLTLRDVSLTPTTVPGTNHYHEYTPKGTVKVTN